MVRPHCDNGWSRFAKATDEGRLILTSRSRSDTGIWWSGFCIPASLALAQLRLFTKTPKDWQRCPGPREHPAAAAAATARSSAQLPPESVEPAAFEQSTARSATAAMNRSECQSEQSAQRCAALQRCAIAASVALRCVSADSVALNRPAACCCVVPEQAAPPSPPNRAQWQSLPRKRRAK